jgi:hypothetical protein
MALGIGSGLWGLVVPVQKTNYIQNPSGEYGTAGWGTVQAGTVGTTAQVQQYGAWAGSVAPTSNGTSGAYFGTFAASNGSAYTISAYVRGANGVPYQLCVTDTSNANRQGSALFTGGGTWQRVNYSYTEASGGTRRVIVQKASGADTSAFYVDGVQVEDGSLTSYTDGDQPGCQWLGNPHASISQRSGQYRGGGSVIAFADLGWNVDQMPGAGIAPLENSSQSYAIIDGAQFQRTRVATRALTLTAKPVSGTSTQDFHITRRFIWDAIKPDLVSPIQPVRLLYVGAQGTQQMDAYYDHGFELGDMDGPMAENFAMGFVATNPYWYAPTQQGTALTNRIYLGSANFFAWRNQAGQWGTIGANGSTIQNAVLVRDILYNPAGTLFFGGQFSTVMGTVGRFVGMYYPATNTFGTLAGGTLNAANTVYALQQSTDGTLYIGGDFNVAGGTAGAAGLALWTGAFGTFAGAQPTGGAGEVRALKINASGSLFLGGKFTALGGTTAGSVGFIYQGSAGTLTGGVGISAGASDVVQVLDEGLDGRIFIGGFFASLAGTTANGIGFWNGGYGTMAGGLNSSLNASAVQPNGYLTAGGFFTLAGSGSALYIANWNGVQYAPLGLGVTTPAAVTPAVFGLFYDDFKNELYVGGRITNVGSVQVNDGFAIWNGAVWRSADWDIADTAGTVRTFAQTPDGTVYLAGRFFGTARAAAITTVVNNGRAEAYPTLRVRNNTTGTARLYQLVNTLTNDGVYFNLNMIPGEVVTLITQPGARSFTSSVRGNVFGAILPGSNLATFRLLSGTNTLSWFADNDNLQTSLYWTPRGWSADSGTIY